MKPEDRTGHRHTERQSLLWPVAGMLSALFLLWTVAAPFAPVPETFPASANPVTASQRLTNLFSAITPAHAAMTALAEDRISIVIDDFDASPVGGFPEHWEAWRGDTDDARKLYTIGEEDGNRYLEAQDDGSSIIIRRELREWNPREYPILSWRWRARALPKGGDERVGSKNDSAVAIYVVLSQSFFRIPRTLKYVWSTTLPVGTRHRRDGIGRPNVIVLRSGPGRVGEWITETVNVYEDYMREFDKEPPDEAIGIGVLTDGNATKSKSEGDYDDFVVYRHRDGS